ncbi:MAG: hypothetical protein ACYCY6_02000 [Minisyncoccota bacterium]
MSEAVRELFEGGDFGDNHFVLVEAHEILRVTEGGRVHQSLGFIMDDSVATRVQMYDDKNTGSVSRDGLVRVARLILTNGTNSFMLDKPIVILDMFSVKSKKRDEFLSKLSPVELEILSLSQGYVGVLQPIPQEG